MVRSSLHKLVCVVLEDLASWVVSHLIKEQAQKQGEMSRSSSRRSWQSKIARSHTCLLFSVDRGWQIGMLPVELGRSSRDMQVWKRLDDPAQSNLLSEATLSDVHVLSQPQYRDLI